MSKIILVALIVIKNKTGTFCVPVFLFYIEAIFCPDRRVGFYVVVYKFIFIIVTYYMVVEGTLEY